MHRTSGISRSKAGAPLLMNFEWRLSLILPSSWSRWRVRARCRQVKPYKPPPPGAGQGLWLPLPRHFFGSLSVPSNGPFTRLGVSCILPSSPHPNERLGFCVYYLTLTPAGKGPSFRQGRCTFSMS